MFNRSIIIPLLLCMIIALTSIAQAITYEFNFNGEPAGDVNRYDEHGNVTAADGFKDIDLKKFYTGNGTGDNLTLTMGTSSKSITTAENVKYVFRIFTDAENKTGYNITYQNGTIELVKFDDGKELSNEDITSLGGIIKDKNEELLQVNFPKNKYLEEDKLEYLGVDGFSWMEEDNYTYIDYIHDLPGNPGTIAPDIVDDPGLTGGGSDSDDDGGSSGLILVVVVIIVVIVIIVLMLLMKRKK